MPSPLRAVLFDLDGTLIDSIGLIVAAMHHAFEGFDGTVPADAEWMAGIGTPLYKQLALYARSPRSSTCCASGIAHISSSITTR